jgi:hypothetical protein
VLPLAALLAVTVALIAGVTSASGSGIDKVKLDTSLATAFGHLHRMRVDDVGPGNHWRCVVAWQIPGATATGSAVYQLDVTQTGGTWPTVMDRRRSTPSSRFTPPRVTRRIACGSSTEPSIC